ncbi:MAG: hypothetical protein RJA52_1073 [Bacteroidota bacterium]
MGSSRVAVSVFFFINGFLYANLMSRLPFLKGMLELNNSQLGVLLFMLAFGALLGMPLAGHFAVKYGSAKVAFITGLIFCGFIAFTAFSKDYIFTAAMMLLTGASDGSMDVCINGQAVLIERVYQKSIMSSFHALFSIGMFLGGLTGSAFSKIEISLFYHLLIFSVISLFLILKAAPKLLPEENKQTSKVEKRWKKPPLAVMVLGIMAFCCFTAEGSMVDWSAMYLTEYLKQSNALGGLAFGVFGGGMTLGRVFGDYFINRFSSDKMLIINSLLAITGFLIFLIFGNIWSAFVGFFMIGLGASTIVPIVFSSAGNLPGVNPSVGIAFATSVGYLGLFFGPPTIGFLSDLFNLRLAFLFSLTLMLILFTLVVFRLHKMKVE